MRPGYLVGIIVGLLLIYLSLYGLAGFGISLDWTSTNSLPANDDFVTFTSASWVSGSGGSIGQHGTALEPALNVSVTGANPAGSTVELQAGPGGVGTYPTSDSFMENQPIATNALNNITTYTVAFRMKANFTSDTANSANLGTAWFYLMPATAPNIQLQITDATIWNGGAGNQWSWSVPQDSSLTAWHVYTMCVTANGPSAPQSMDIYRDTTKIGTAVKGSSSQSGQFQLEFDAWYGSLCLDVDYVYVTSGLNPPTAQTATLTVNTVEAGSPLSGVLVTAGSSQQTTTSTGTVSFTESPGANINVQVPSTVSGYSWSSWSDAGTISHQVTMPSAGGTLTMTATYAPTATYSLTINAQSSGVAISGMSVTVNSGSPQTVTTSGATFGPYTTQSVTAVIDSTYGTYTFSSWLNDGSSNTRGPENLNAGSNIWTAIYTQGSSNTYSLIIKAQCNGVAISGMSATVNGQPQTITSSGTSWGPYTSSSVTASIDQTSGSYTFSYWSVNGVNVGSNAPTSLNVGANTWTAIYTQGGGTTYSLTIKAQGPSGSLSGMNAMVNSQTLQIASSGTTWGPYTNPTVSVTIDSTFSSYTFSYWSIGGSNYGSSPPTTLNVGSNTWTAVYTSSGPNVDIFTQFIAWLRTELDKPLVREAELGFGGLLTLVSVIGFFWPGSKKQIQYVMAPSR